MSQLPENPRPTGRDRDKDICYRAIVGKEMLSSIAKEYGISPHRAREIMNRYLRENHRGKFLGILHITELRGRAEEIFPSAGAE